MGSWIEFLSTLGSICGGFWEGPGPLGGAFWRLWALLGRPGGSLKASWGVLGLLALISDVFFIDLTYFS